MAGTSGLVTRARRAGLALALASTALVAGVPQGQPAVAAQPFPIQLIDHGVVDASTAEVTRDGSHVLLWELNTPYGWVDTETGDDVAGRPSGADLYEVVSATQFRQISSTPVVPYTVNFPAGEDWSITAVTSGGTGRWALLTASSGVVERTKAFLFDTTANTLDPVGGLPDNSTDSEGQSVSDDESTIIWYEGAPNPSEYYVLDVASGNETPHDDPQCVYPSTISPNGEWMAFACDDVLASGTTGPGPYVYRKHLPTGVIETIPVDEADMPIDRDAWQIGDNGLFAFHMLPRTGPFPDRPQLFVFDEGQPTEVSRAFDGSPADEPIDDFWLSDDGTVLIFESFANNLTSETFTSRLRRQYRIDLTPPPPAPQPGPGFARFIDPNEQGAGQIIADYQFRRGWTSITNVDLDGDGPDEILYYNANTGFARFINPNEQGAGQIIADYQFRRGWTSITNVDLDGDATDEILYYNANTGFARFIDPNLAGAGQIIADYQFRTGWTSVTNLDLDGDGSDEIFYYQR